MRPGSTVALIMPMNDRGDIDYPELRSLLQMHVAQGTDNLCILGTTGEASVLSMKEREDVLKVAVDECKGRMPILVGTGTIDPRAVRAMTQQAIDLGCDANLLVSPYYVKPPQRCLMNHMVAIADMGLPLVMYNIPGRTGVDITDDNLATLLQHDDIVGVKDATGDVSRVVSLRKALAAINGNDTSLLYSGDDGTSLDFVLAGGDGCISVTANLVPKIMATVMKLAKTGDDTEQARALNAPLLTLHNKLFVETNPIPAKWAARQMGLIASDACRPPLDTMDPVFEPAVRAALQEAGLL